MIPPGITAIAKDTYSIGIKSAEILLRQISGEKKSEPVFLKMESSLCVRGSTDPALAEKFPVWNLSAANLEIRRFKAATSQEPVLTC